MTALAGLWQPGLPDPAVQEQLRRLPGPEDPTARVIAIHRGWGARSPGTACLPGLQVAADARLVNRQTLLGKLASPPAPDTDDATLILAAYRQWGTACVEHLEGDFAFVVFDGVTLFCARDALGVRPLCYGRLGGRTAFGSDAATVARLLGAPVNETRVAESLVYPLEHADRHTTLFRHVHRLPPASVLQLSSDSSGEPVSYWCPGDVAPSLAGPEEQLEQFTWQLQQAVAERRGASPAAVMMSGGVDSVTVAALAAQSGEARVFSTVSTDSDCTESGFIRLAQSALPVDAVNLSEADIAESADEVLKVLAEQIEPFDTWMLQAMLLNRQARERGHVEIMDGVEGDLLHALPPGYPTWLFRQGRWRSGLRASRQAWHNGIDRLPGYPLQLYRDLRRLGVPGWLGFLKPIRRAMGGDPYRWLDELMIVPGVIEQAGIRARLQAMEARQASLPADSLRTAFDARVSHAALPAAFERYDRVAAAAGVRAIHPLADVRLVRLSLAMPFDLLAREGWSKYPVRAAGAGHVPDPIRWRRDKEENAWRFNQAFVDATRDRLHEAVRTHRGLLEDYIRSSVLDAPEDAELLPLFVLGSWLARSGL